MRNQWVLDGIGSITGTPAGQSYGTNRKILPELKPYLAKDGVHLNDMGSRNVATSITDVLSKMGTGKLESEGGPVPVPDPAPY
jgi:lysophospholipase L1-like esterase